MARSPDTARDWSPGFSRSVDFVPFPPEERRDSHKNRGYLKLESRLQPVRSPGKEVHRGARQTRTESPLTEEVLQAMSIPQPRSIALTVLFLGAVATVAGSLPTALARNDDANSKPAPGRMFVVGRVLDPNGKPVPGATVAVHARSLTLGRAPY